MRKIVTAVSAAALALSMVAMAVPASAVTGYDSAYAGESAFVNISPGQTLNFQVFFANTGTTTWSRGTGTQVDLAGCLDDKTTCNSQDATEASWNSGWLSATRYASTVQTTTAPGALGTFSYNIAAPANVTAGTYRFNGDLVLSSTGEKIHPEGYYQDATVGGNGTGATLTGCTSNSTDLACDGTANGGTTVTLTGSGFVCTPAFPSVSFGGTNAAVTSCGSTTLVATSPAHAPGAVALTVTNSGGAASNALTYTYADTTKPVFNAMSVTGKLVTITWSEPVCRLAGVPGTDWTVNNVSSNVLNPVTADSTPACTGAKDNGVLTSTLQLTNTISNGAFVETTLNAVGASTTANSDFSDAASNAAAAPQSRQATATPPETTPPTITSATGAIGALFITLNFSEPVQCLGTLTAADFSITDNISGNSDPSITAVGTTNPCGNSATTADTSFSLETTALPADRTFTVTAGATAAGKITDIVGNALAVPASVTFTTGASDFTPPTIVDARLTGNAGTTDFTEVGDAFSLTFSEAMNGAGQNGGPAGSMQIQDQDGTVFTLTCDTTTGNPPTPPQNVTCLWNTALTQVTVTVASAITAPGVGSAGAGTTPGMQIPFNVTTLNGFTDAQGNVPNVLGSPDRLVDYE
jgi:hypothetical protein